MMNILIYLFNALLPSDIPPLLPDELNILETITNRNIHVCDSQYYMLYERNWYQIVLLYIVSDPYHL